MLLVVEVEEDIVIDAWRLYSEKNVDCADALLSVKSKRNFYVLTWDKKDFQKINCEYFTPSDLIGTIHLFIKGAACAGIVHHKNECFATQKIKPPPTLLWFL